jgi:hypothetical protein
MIVPRWEWRTFGETFGDAAAAPFLTSGRSTPSSATASSRGETSENNFWLYDAL